MEKYFELLIEQFKEAKGITKEVDTKSTSFISEFSGWINYINSISSNYRELLEYMKLYNYYNWNLGLLVSILISPEDRFIRAESGSNSAAPHNKSNKNLSS